MRPIYKTGGVFPPLQNTNDIIREVYDVIMYWDEEEPPPNLQLTTITWKPGGYWEFGYGWYKQENHDSDYCINTPGYSELSKSIKRITFTKNIIL